MNDYPLSTVSSKKIKKTSRDHLEKSACQLDLPPAPQKAIYEHILKGQRLFIELYYQGKVLETEYNKYVEFMGGTLYKRLNAKVTILLTNTEQQELANILERVKRICPSCKVVSILWFQLSFQNKCKMPFDSFLLDKTQKSKQNTLSKKEAKVEQLNLEAYFDNIIEDTHIFYKDYFARNKLKHFEYANNKKEKLPPHHCLTAQEFQLQPVAKRKTNKAESIDKKVRKTHRATARFAVNKEVEQTKVCKSDKTKNTKDQKAQIKQSQQSKEQKQEQQNQVVGSTLPEQKGFENRDINSLMQKYLMNTDSEDISIAIQPFTIKQDSQKSISFSKQSKRTVSAKGIESKSTKQQALSKPKIQKFAITPKYKDIKFQTASQNEAEKMLAVERLKVELSKAMPNRLLIVSNSKRLLQKVEQTNKQHEGSKYLYFRYVDYETYWQFMHNSPIKHQAYFPINPRRIIDRPLFFALKSTFPNAPKPVSYNMLKQVAAFNKKAAEKKQEMDFTLISYTKDTINIVYCQNIIKNKRITFMQSELSTEILRLIVDRLGGYFIAVSHFMSGKVDIVVTSRNHIKKSDCDYLTQQELWQKVFPLKFPSS